MPVPAPVAGISIDGIALAWHSSHAAVVGTCLGLKPLKVFGDIPVNVAAVMFAPWQATQLLVIPAWLVAELGNLAPLGTGVNVLELAPPGPTLQSCVPSGMCLVPGVGGV